MVDKMEFYDADTALHEVDKKRLNDMLDFAKNYQWKELETMLDDDKKFSARLINQWRIGGSSKYTILHQCAEGGAPKELVKRIIKLGGSKVMRTFVGELPSELAKYRANTEILKYLEPKIINDVPYSQLKAMERQFTTKIRSAFANVFKDTGRTLPPIELFLEMDSPTVKFSLPGMQGTLTYELLGNPKSGFKIVGKFVSKANSQPTVYTATENGCIVS